MIKLITKQIFTCDFRFTVTRILTVVDGSYFNVDKMDLWISIVAGILTSSVLDHLGENSGLGLRFFIISQLR